MARFARPRDKRRSTINRTRPDERASSTEFAKAATMRELNDARASNGHRAPAEALGKRADMTKREAEAWRPPPFAPLSTGAQRVIAVLRRFFDLQAGTIWRDLRILLPQCKGVVLDVGCGAQPCRTLVSPRVTYIGI